MEEIIKSIFYVILIIPGAFIRWGLGGFKKSFADYIDTGDEIYNIMITLALIGIGVFLYRNFLG